MFWTVFFIFAAGVRRVKSHTNTSQTAWGCWVLTALWCVTVLCLCCCLVLWVHRRFSPVVETWTQQGHCVTASHLPNTSFPKKKKNNLQKLRMIQFMFLSDDMQMKSMCGTRSWKKTVQNDEFRERNVTENLNSIRCLENSLFEEIVQTFGKYASLVSWRI